MLYVMCHAVNYCRCSVWPLLMTACFDCGQIQKFWLMGVEKCVRVLPSVGREFEYGCFRQPAAERPGCGALLTRDSLGWRFVGSWQDSGWAGGFASYLLVFSLTADRWGGRWVLRYLWPWILRLQTSKLRYHIVLHQQPCTSPHSITSQKNAVLLPSQIHIWINWGLASRGMLNRCLVLFILTQSVLWILLKHLHNAHSNLNEKVQSVKWTEKKSFCACIKHFAYKNVLNKKTLTSRKQF